MNDPMWYRSVPPRWNGRVPDFFANPEKEGAEVELADFLHSYYFWLAWDGKENTLDTTSAMARANAEIATKTFIQTKIMSSLFDRSADYQLMRINELGLYALVDGEYESLQEYLSARLEDVLIRVQKGDLKPGNGEVSDLLYLVQNLIPQLQQAGVVIENLVSVTKNYAKLRGIVPSLRQTERVLQLKIEDAPPAERDKVRAEANKEYAEEATRLLDIVMNPSIVPADLPKALGKVPEVPKIEGYTFIKPGKTVFVIEAPADIYSFMIRKGLSNIVEDWISTDAQAFMDELAYLLMGRE
jgi:hypothetical protein